MTGTMTWVGPDVHARSTHDPAIDAMTGELTRARFEPGVQEPVAWLDGLRVRCVGVMRRGRPGAGCIARRSGSASTCR